MPQTRCTWNRGEEINQFNNVLHFLSWIFLAKMDIFTAQKKIIYKEKGHIRGGKKSQNPLNDNYWP